MAADSFVQEESPAELLSLCSSELAARRIDDMERHSSVTRLEPVRSKKPLAAWPEERIVNGGAGVPASGVIPPAPPPLRSRGGARTSGDRLHG
jgi:hypothetical protein